MSERDFTPFWAEISRLAKLDGIDKQTVLEATAVQKLCEISDGLYEIACHLCTLCEEREKSTLQMEAIAAVINGMARFSGIIENCEKSSS